MSAGIPNRMVVLSSDGLEKSIDDRLWSIRRGMGSTVRPSYIRPLLRGALAWQQSERSDGHLPVNEVRLRRVYVVPPTEPRPRRGRILLPRGGRGILTNNNTRPSENNATGGVYPDGSWDRNINHSPVEIEIEIERYLMCSIERAVEWLLTAWGRYPVSEIRQMLDAGLFWCPPFVRHAALNAFVHFEEHIRVGGANPFGNDANLT